MKGKEGENKTHTRTVLQLYHQDFLFQMSNTTGDEGSFSSGNTGEEVHQEKQKQQLQHPLDGSSSGLSGTAATNSNSSTSGQQQMVKRKRNLPGTPGKFNQSQEP